jgi:putative methylase
VAPHPQPKAYLEQYTVPENVAAEMLYIAAYANDDIIGKNVVDLGCGTGRLAIGAALLGAKEIFAIDIDRVAVKLAKKNAVKLNVDNMIHWIIADIDVLRGVFDTAVQNPPFGVQKRKADRKFLQKSLEIAQRVYSLHKGESKKRLVELLKERKTGIIPVKPSPFLSRFIEKQGGKIRGVYAMVMTIQYMFRFHKKRRHQFLVNLYVLEKKVHGKSLKSP